MLLATPDLNLVVRRMIEQVAAQEKGVGSLLPERPEGCFAQKTPDPFFQSWVFAPEELASRFDEFGCARVEAWRDTEIELRTEQVEIVERPSDQAAAVLQAIAGYGGRHAAAEITVGVPDEEVVPYIEQQFEQHELVAHHAAGLPVGRTGPFRLLEVAADFVERRRADDFAALVRHPDVQTWLRPDTQVENWIGALDEFAAAHLQASLQPAAFSSLPESATLRDVHQRVEQWLACLAGKRPIAEWAEPLLELVLAVYGERQLDRNDAVGRVVIQACESLHKVLQQFHGLDSRARPVVDAATALRLALRLADGEKIPPPPRRDAIELLGWLELPLDDAPALIVTGFNEGLVPDSINEDAFLPNRLRHQLGLLDNDRRYARDAYALSAILASHAEKEVGSFLPDRPEGYLAQKTPDPFFHIIAGRRTADFEPRTPSRLLFACSDPEIARRIPQFFPEADYRPRPCVGGSTASALLPAAVESGKRVAQRPLNNGGEPGGVAYSSRFDTPKLAPLVQPITSMSVTSFRDYLACPYRFYLRHVLGLKAVEPADELDPLGFGTLTHEVLSRFGRDPIKDSSDADAIGKFLHAQLDQLVADTFGPDAVPAVRVQVEQLRLRLDAFARCQAERREAGWRIVHVELSIDREKSVLVVDGQPMVLRGRIDRIDRHDRDGTWCVLDYKTSEEGDKPDKALGRDGTWRDLQLPLYRHLVRTAGIADAVQLGYIVLPRDPKQVDVLIAQWTEDELKSADEAARDVIRGVRAGRFDGPTSPPPKGFDEYAWICQEGRTVPRTDDDEEDEP